MEPDDNFGILNNNRISYQINIDGYVQLESFHLIFPSSQENIGNSLRCCCLVLLYTNIQKMKNYNARIFIPSCPYLQDLFCLSECNSHPTNIHRITTK